MKKLYILTISALALVPFCANASQPLATPELEAKMEKLWTESSKLYYSPKTNLFYTGRLDKMPSPELMKEYKPLNAKGNLNYMGGGTGIEDCSMLGGIILAGLCDKYAVSPDEATADRARKMAAGLILADTVHGLDGFVARGVSPIDGKTIYPETSRDQYTHNIHGLWRFYNSPIANDAEKKTIDKIFRAAAEKMKREIRPDSEPPYTYKLYNDVPDKRGVAKMHDVYPHEAARLGMIYAAAYATSKEKKYLNWYNSIYNDIAGGSAKFLGMREGYYKHLVPAYSIAQMHASLELVREVEPDPKRKIQLSQIMDAISNFVDKYPVYYVSDKSVRDSSEIIWGQILAKGYKLTDERREILVRNIMKASPYDSAGCYTILAAYWRARLDDKNGK